MLVVKASFSIHYTIVINDVLFFFSSMCYSVNTTLWLIKIFSSYNIGLLTKKMRFYCRILNISCRDLILCQEICNLVRAEVGPFEVHLTTVKERHSKTV